MASGAISGWKFPFALPILTVALAAYQPAVAQFASQNVSQHAWLDLVALGGGDNANDCWGYVSPSGREYALVGLSNKLVVVEITTPTAPAVVGSVAHSNSLWADVKVFQDHCYVVNEAGGGMDVIDLSDVDNGAVSLVQRLTTGGLTHSHNVAINTASGFLYLIGSNLNSGAPVAFDLADPDNPVEAGRWTEASAAYHHDAQIVTYTSGPYAGREILFGFSESRGVDVVDVTDKSNMFLMSRTSYPGVQYCHQGWTSDDLQYLFVDDELDEYYGATPTQRTLIFDIRDLASPVLVSQYVSGLNVIDHNLYVREGYVYEANYRSGLRILCAEDPLNPVEVGFYDTWPGTDLPEFDGAWSVFPFFPSGTVIVSDIDRGLFVLDVSAALSDTSAGILTFGYPSGRPELIDPAGGTTVRVVVDGTCGGLPQAGSAQFHYDAGGGFTSAAMTPVSPNEYDAVFPAAPCGQTVRWYVSAEDAATGLFNDPDSAPAETYSATSALAVALEFEDDFESDQGWTVSGNATDGQWTRGVPVDCQRGDPPTDSDNSGQCWLTDNDAANACNSDVDGGATVLTSPVFDLQPGDTVSYDYWISDGPGVFDGDSLTVEVATDAAGTNWSLVRTYTTPEPAWRTDSIDIGTDVPASSTTRFRFSASDLGNPSLIEAGLDAFRIETAVCAPPAPNPPDGVSAGDAEQCETVRVTWNSVVDATDYAVWRNTAGDPGGASQIASGIVETLYDDGTAAPGTTFFYWVRACNTSGCSDLSSSDSGLGKQAGDFNGDARTDGLDVQGFSQAFVNPPFYHTCGDLAAPFGGALDAADTAAFVSFLLQ